MRGILSVVIGAVLGALVVTILLRDAGTDDGSPAAATSAVQGPTAPRPDGPLEPASSGPDSGEPEMSVPLEDIAAITDPAARRRAALALLDVYGHDAAGIATVAASLPPDEAVNFRIHAIAELGANDLSAALDAAMRLPDHEQQRLALLRLAPVLAGTDPAAAIAGAEQLGSAQLELEFLAALLDAWAVRDPDGVFAYLEAADSFRVSAAELPLAALAAVDPERLLALAEELRRDIAQPATMAALEVLIERDAPAALARMEALPPGSEASRLQYTAAEVYGERDPAAAWDWATASGADALARIGVVRGIQKVDPDQAWEIMLSQLNSADGRIRAGTREYLLNYVNGIVSSDSPDDIVTGLDRLLSLDDPRVDSAMQTNIQAWANRDPEAALDWSLRNLDRINADNVLTSLSSGLARTNIDLARQTIFRLDEGQRIAWAAGVGRSLAERDLPAARAWAYELPSGPLRDAGLHEVIRGESHAGSVDRQLFEQFSSDRARGEAASSAARRFACDGRTELALEIATAYISDQGLLDRTRAGIEQNADSGAFTGSFLCQFAL